jgi:hypothetical protein
MRSQTAGIPYQIFNIANTWAFLMPVRPRHSRYPPEKVEISHLIMSIINQKVTVQFSWPQWPVVHVRRFLVHWHTHSEHDKISISSPSLVPLLQPVPAMHRFRKDKPGARLPPSEADFEKAPVVTGVSTEGSGSKNSTDDVEQDLSAFAQSHSWDPNLESSKLDAIKNAVHGHDVEAEVALEHELEENSPYPEVVSAVQNWDDSSLPANTVRSWIIGMSFVTIGSGMNMLFSLRQPTISVGNLVAQICAYPIGMLMAWGLPTHQFNTCGLKWTLNPGPFNKKEHTLIVVMANVSFSGGAAYSTFALEAMRGFYNVNFGIAFSILLTLATQVTGIALAGMFRRFLVDPPSSIYPSILPVCVLFNTLHDDRTQSDPSVTSGWVISRFRFFTYVLIGGFIWYWFPGFLFQGLSTFAWVTW